ncbi:hypothetical protein QO002_005455 [Pararhizobium capsulatum DSM 1112]|uniref:Uncharacterized protein n=1 Tax=Pararhizobium capsulatum DSM 1112 TaxID=1121113 RepID=A0ABU0BYB2_9HYPH|nr:hypothetical protein [Pararhizobium capsulatum]MDQ0323249.1 hypothetical protein [Pararhizobium capsulatum DSM 1112]
MRNAPLINHRFLQRDDGVTELTVSFEIQVGSNDVVECELLIEQRLQLALAKTFRDEIDSYLLEGRVVARMPDVMAFDRLQICDEFDTGQWRDLFTEGAIQVGCGLPASASITTRRSSAQ